MNAVPFDPFAFCMLMFLIFVQFNSHLPCMRACDELFAGCGTPVQMWWAKRRSLYDRWSLGLYAFCFYSYLVYQVREFRSMLLWMRMREESKKGEAMHVRGHDRFNGLEPSHYQ